MAALRHAGPGDLYPATPWPDGGPAAGSSDGGCRVWVRVDALHCLVKTCPCPGTMYGRARAIGMDSCRAGSAAFGDRKDRVGDKAVRLAVHGDRGVGVRRLDQAEDPAVLLVNPVLPVVHAVPALRLEVGPMGSGDLLG